MNSGTLLETGTNHPSSSIGDLIQADLHFQSAAGYGQWRILCSRVFLSDMTRDNAQSNEVLGRLRYVFVIFNSSGLRRNPRIHRELSLGYFSEANQKRLTRDSPIDIYRARLPGSRRLVVSDVIILRS